MPPRTACSARLLSSSSDSWTIEERYRLPELGFNEVLVRNSFIGLNPFDWKGIKYKFSLSETPAVLGRDGSGTIIAVGSAVRRVKVGDKVWYCANSGRANRGAFQEFSIHSANEVGPLPSKISLRSAATLGTGLVTAAVVLFKCLQQDIGQLQSQKKRCQDGRWIFIVSGSGSTGQYLIQLSHLIGLRVICTASMSNYESLRALGADVVLDRHTPDDEKVAQIREATQQTGVCYAVDNVGSPTVQLCHRVLDSDGDLPEGRLVALAGASKEPYGGVRPVCSIPISFSTTYFDHPEFSITLMDVVCALLETDLLRPLLYDLAPHGLSGIRDALLRLEQNQVPSMRKLIIAAKHRPTKVDQTADLRQIARHQSTHRQTVVKRKAVSDDGKSRAIKAVYV